MIEQYENIQVNRHFLKNDGYGNKQGRSLYETDVLEDRTRKIITEKANNNNNNPPKHVIEDFPEINTLTHRLKWHMGHSLLEGCNHVLMEEMV